MQGLSGRCGFVQVPCDVGARTREGGQPDTRARRGNKLTNPMWGPGETAPTYYNPNALAGAFLRGEEHHVHRREIDAL